MELVVFVSLLIVLAVTSLVWGVDSRDGGSGWLVRK